MTDIMQYEQFEHGEFEPISEDSTEIITINEFGQEVRSVSKIQRICDFCQATQTPMWRRGPGGKGTLCNACGVKWSLRRRPVVVTTKKFNSPSAVGNLALIEQNSAIGHDIVPRKRGRKPKHIQEEESKDIYYCKYCNVTWPVHFFKNRQQFGAHCSNCSRKRNIRVDEYQLLARKQFLESDGEEAIIKNCKAEAMQKTWGGRSFLEEPHESDADLIANADTNGLSKLLFAVENVLNEEKEMDTVRNQMGNVKKTIHKAENDTKVAVDSLESWIEKQVNFVKDGICLIRPKLEGRDVGIEFMPKLVSARSSDQAARPEQPIEDIIVKTTSDLKEILSSLSSLPINEQDLQELQRSIAAKVSTDHGQVATWLSALYTNLESYKQMQEQLQQQASLAGTVLKSSHISSYMYQTIDHTQQLIQSIYEKMHASVKQCIEDAKKRMVEDIKAKDNEFENRLAEMENKLSSKIDEARMQVRHDGNDINIKLALVDSMASDYKL